jgi:hypothetical protein
MTSLVTDAFRGLSEAGRHLHSTDYGGYWLTVRAAYDVNMRHSGGEAASLRRTAAALGLLELIKQSNFTLNNLTIT